MRYSTIKSNTSHLSKIRSIRTITCSEVSRNQVCNKPLQSMDSSPSLKITYCETSLLTSSTLPCNMKCFGIRNALPPAIDILLLSCDTDWFASLDILFQHIFQLINGAELSGLEETPSQCHLPSNRNPDTLMMLNVWARSLTKLGIDVVEFLRNQNVSHKRRLTVQ